MINIFTVPSTDQSIYYLGQIFGFVGTVLPVQQASLVLGVMFQKFNTVVLSVGALIVLYVTIVGVMKTAQEGEFLGKQWNNIWIPIRMVIGIAALVPSPSGYCAIQILVMWVVIQGVGAADVLWNAVLQYSNVAGSPVASVSVPNIGVQSNFQTLFQGLACQETAHSASPFQPNKPATDGGYYCYDPSTKQRLADPFCNKNDLDLTDIKRNSTSSQATIDNIAYYYLNYPMGPNGYCGSMQYCDAETTCSRVPPQNDPNYASQTILCGSCTAQQITLQNTVNTFSAIAQQLYASDLEFRQFVQGGQQATPPQDIQAYCSASGIQGCCVKSPADDPQGKNCGITSAIINAGDNNNADTNTVKTLYWPFLIKPKMIGDIQFISVATDNYVSVVGKAIMDSIGKQMGQTGFSDQVLQQATEQGWIFAGAYYYYLAKANNKITGNSLPPLQVSSSDPKSVPSVLSSLRNNYQAANDLVSAVNAGSGAAQSSFTGSLPQGLQDLSRLSDALQASGAGVISSFMYTITGAGKGQLASNPLANLQNLGFILIVVAQTLFALAIAIVVPLALIGYLDVFVLGTGVNNPVGPVITLLAIIFVPLFSFLLGAMFTFGAMLAVYLPLIPYIIFTMGAIAWFILVIEAMVAAPLVALGILMPSGSHEILGKSEHALMYLFGIFLRPSLMIFGMVAAMLLSIVVVTMINASFAGVVGSIYTNLGLVEIMLFIAAYVALVLAALNKCFALIHIIPDRTLRWMGGTAGSEGQEAAGEAVGEAKKGVGAGAGAARAGGAAAAGRGKVFAKSVKGYKKAKEEAKKPSAPTATGESGGGGEGGGEGEE